MNTQTMNGEFSFDMFYADAMVSVAWSADVAGDKATNVKWEVTEGKAPYDWFHDMLMMDIQDALRRRNSAI